MKRIFIFYDSDLMDVISFDCEEVAKQAYLSLVKNSNRYSYLLLK